jgi:hypothetical protein
MRWQGRRQSENIEDRRRMQPVAVAGGGLGIVGIIVILVYTLLGGDPRPLLENMPPPGQAGGPMAGGAEAPAGEPGAAEADPMRQFVGVILADTEDVWNELLPRELGVPYREPTLVLFSGRVESACGLASAAVGPFYCPADQKLYIDLSFYEELKDRLGAPGDFAQAYVIAHEIGHHVQNLLGLSDQVHRMQQRASKVEANQLSVRLELQADYLAGVWAHHAQRSKSILEAGDVAEGLNAASAIGDDTLQRQAQGYVRPDAFTHGSSQQRERWFRRGLETGELSKEVLNQFFEAEEL